MTIAFYVRVSSGSQDTRGQEIDLRKWAATQDGDSKWFRDAATGTKMERPGMDRLLAEVRAGGVQQVVVWRLDRLGRTARGLHELLGELVERRIGFISLKDSIDLSTPSGRLMMGVLASVAQFETEVRSERQQAGIEAVRAANGGRCPWGGRKAGTRVRVTPAKEKVIRQMKADGVTVTTIAATVGLSRPTVYGVLTGTPAG